MTYEIIGGTPESFAESAERMHDYLATEHGRENVLIRADSDKVQVCVSCGVGTRDSSEVFDTNIARY